MNSASIPNKIRELRLKRGLTQAELGDLVGTAQNNVARYELGQRGLDEELMRKFAKALGVAPGDLFDTVTLASIQPDVEVELEGNDELLRPLFRLSITPCRVLTDAVERAGVAPGSRILINGQAKIDDSAPGSIVAVEITRADGSRTIVLRQFIPPAILTTNRTGANSAMSLDDPDLAMRYIGTVVSE